MEIFEKLPDELKRKIISYFVRPPHYHAYITGIRRVFNNELNCKISGNFKLKDPVDAEWEVFLGQYDYDYTDEQIQN